MNTFPDTGKYQVQVDYYHKIYLTEPKKHTQYSNRSTHGYMFRINNLCSADEFVNAHEFQKYIDTKHYEPLILLYCYGDF